jgi:hypothetical protein
MHISGALDPVLLDEIEHFPVSYNEVRGKEFKPRRRLGPAKQKTGRALANLALSSGQLA